MMFFLKSVFIIYYLLFLALVDCQKTIWECDFNSDELPTDLIQLQGHDFKWNLWPPGDGYLFLQTAERCYTSIGRKGSKSGFQIGKNLRLSKGNGKLQFKIKLEPGCTLQVTATCNSKNNKVFEQNKPYWKEETLHIRDCSGPFKVVFVNTGRKYVRDCVAYIDDIILLDTEDGPTQISDDAMIAMGAVFATVMTLIVVLACYVACRADDDDYDYEDDEEEEPTAMSGVANTDGDQTAIPPTNTKCDHCGGEIILLPATLDPNKPDLTKTPTLYPPLSTVM
ncbi:uncharacterized protein [Antedon mediterranea]|uniref:uncharacterized protein n=1 Tax=Antedon mediterranea TaxID=105859 RepID=UPI003AF7739B